MINYDCFSIITKSGVLRKGAEHHFFVKNMQKKLQVAGSLQLEKSLKMPRLIFLTFFTINNQKNNDKVHKRWNNDNRTEL